MRVLRLWILFSIIIVFGVVVLAVEYLLERFPIFALALFVIGGLGRFLLK